MTTIATIEELASAKDAALRVIARALIKSQADNMEDFVQVLGEELGKHVDDYAQRTGDYDRAAVLSIVASHLMELDSVIENYDPTINRGRNGWRDYRDAEHCWNCCREWEPAKDNPLICAYCDAWADDAPAERDPDDARDERDERMDREMDR